MLVKKRVSILFVSILLALGCFVACGDDDDEVVGSNASVSKAQFAFQSNYPQLQWDAAGVDVYEVNCKEIREEGAETSYRIKSTIIIKSSDSLMAMLNVGYLGTDTECSTPIMFGAQVYSYRVEGTIDLTDEPGKTADKYYADVLAAYWGGNSAYRDEITKLLPKQVREDQETLEEVLKEFASGEIYSLNVSEIQNDSQKTQFDKDRELKDFFIVRLEDNALYMEFVTNYVVRSGEYNPPIINEPGDDDDDDDDVEPLTLVADLPEEEGIEEDTGRGYSVIWPTVLDRTVVYYKK